jgi:hypothetical protein
MLQPTFLHLDAGTWKKDPLSRVVEGSNPIMPFFSNTQDNYSIKLSLIHPLFVIIAGYTRRVKTYYM